MTADAVVIAVRPGGRVDLEFDAPAACAGCAGTCLWKRIGQSRLKSMPVAQALHSGARVAVGLPARRVLAISLLLHGMPLAAILAGASAGAVIGDSDGSVLAGMVIGIAVVTIGIGSMRQRLERAMLSDLIVTPRP